MINGLFEIWGLHIVIIVFLLWNLAVLLIYAVDKSKAKKSRWRISERTLILCALLLGGLGAWAGMFCFRHKTNHLKFRILVPIGAIISIVSVIFFIYTFLHI